MLHYQLFIVLILIHFSKPEISYSFSEFFYLKILTDPFYDSSLEATAEITPAEIALTALTFSFGIQGQDRPRQTIVHGYFKYSSYWQ